MTECAHFQREMNYFGFAKESGKQAPEPKGLGFGSCVLSATEHWGRNFKVQENLQFNVNAGPLLSAARSEAERALRRHDSWAWVGVIDPKMQTAKREESFCASEASPWPLGGYSKRFPYETFLDEILGFINLGAGWDSYSAKAPSSNAVKNALSFLELLEKHSLKIEWTAPTNDDSVMISIRPDKATQEWDFYSDGDVAVTIIEPSGTKHFIEVMARDIEKILLGRYGQA